MDDGKINSIEDIETEILAKNIHKQIAETTFTACKTRLYKKRLQEKEARKYTSKLLTSNSLFRQREPLIIMGKKVRNRLSS